MTWQQVDYFFPFLVLFYGSLMIFVLENRTLTRLAQERMPDYAPMFKSHRSLAWICFFVGGLWSIQNLLFV